MSISPISKAQWVKITRVVLYAGASAGIAQVISMVAANPLLFGALTPVVNVLLVALKQVFTPAS